MERIIKSNLELHYKCEGCNSISFLSLCERYLEPTRLWKMDGEKVLKGCPLHPNILTIMGSGAKEGILINPLKASRQRARGISNITSSAQVAKALEKKKKGLERRDSR